MNDLPAVVRKTRVCIGIPTFRRPAMLEQLLGSLLPHLASFDARVIVADNDCSDEARAVVARFCARWSQTLYVPVRERGISQARNALVQAALADGGDFDWLVMMDDDGLVTPDWLRTLIATGERYQGHLVGGPVLGLVPDQCRNLFVRNSVLARRKRLKTGPVDLLLTTQNLAIARRLFDLLPLPLFKDELGFTGGEDYDLFRKTKRAGGTLVWCDEAIVRETIEPQRLSTKSILFRYYSSGSSIAQVDVGFDGRLATWAGTLKGLGKSIAKVGVSALRADQNAAADAVMGSLYFVGRISYLLGHSIARYKAAT